MSNYRDDVKAAARGRWAELLASLAGVDPSLLDGSHHGCPWCREGKDRFRFSDMDGDGSCVCATCGNLGDGFAAIQKSTGRIFKDVLQMVGDAVGAKRGKTSHNRGPKADPAEHLEFEPWLERDPESPDDLSPSEMGAAMWAMHKRPIVPAANPADNSKLDIRLAWCSETMQGEYVGHSV